MSFGGTIILIGLRGSGKTTVTRLLAARLKCEMIDLDDRSPAILGEASAGDAIRKHGEAVFRRAELAALLEMLKVPAPAGGRVLALGGGTPTGPGVAELLESARKRGDTQIVYLRASEGTLRSRLRTEDHSNRPTLTGLGVLEEIGVLLNLRDTLYKTLATVVVDVDHADVGRVVDEIVQRVGA